MLQKYGMELLSAPKKTEKVVFIKESPSCRRLRDIGRVTMLTDRIPVACQSRYRELIERGGEDCCDLVLLREEN